MRSLLVRFIFSLGFILAACMSFTTVTAQTDDTKDDTADAVETIEVERAKSKDTKHQSLQFLKDNRVFLRAQLDLLSTKVTHERRDVAKLLDERYLRLKELAEAIAAARDTVGSQHELTAKHELLNSVTELGDLESQLTLMEKLLDEQRERLLWLEQDFLGHQETAMVILIRGLSGKRAPESIVLGEDNELVHVELTAEQRTSLEQGGIAQIYHELAEPREHVFDVRFTGAPWTDAHVLSVGVEAVRDRLTFLELDLSQLDHNREDFGLQTSVWHR